MMRVEARPYAATDRGRKMTGEEVETGRNDARAIVMENDRIKGYRNPTPPVGTLIRTRLWVCLRVVSK